ncbi:short chain dehydrogenase [Kutzneria kofuensis]|uniref:NAD(P)-dependent dehydrogenase (Short-subunit alcohol dehydrogenase family) n=1 Tax=Kutzneria kofuensis TaxID=103725 RepID=A0A7W9KJQ7_9PSEU|nr:short chain dehydrogenase [Kutzneria kofuensis]MBB5893867.1 NAD(P)-dependent dehydrogenase (short-subunit alcohol dehydrogenase family) [Kutzneria kofuensis]
MRILLIGASGLLGRAVHDVLGVRHEVITASRSNGDLAIDITDPASIAAVYDEVGQVDAVACAAGSVPFKPLAELTREDYLAGVTDKVLGQIELVRQGAEHVTGSFTLISGVLAREPIRTGAVASLVNGALESFVMAAAVELPQRINAVSPTVFTEALDAYGDFFPGFEPVPVTAAARAYVKSIEGAATGQVYRLG